MERTKAVMIVGLVAIVLPAYVVTTVGGAAHRCWRLAVALTVDSKWVALDGYYSPIDRGTSAQKLAWEGERASRGSTQTLVRLWALPNLAGRARSGFIVVRALGGAGHTLVRHATVAAMKLGWVALTTSGEDDADRR